MTICLVSLESSTDARFLRHIRFCQLERYARVYEAAGADRLFIPTS